MNNEASMNHELDFGVWLRQMRAVHDLTQEALAEKVGCSTQTVRAFESGRRRPSRDMAARIAAVLHVAPEALADFMRRARAPQFAPAKAALTIDDAPPEVLVAAVAALPSHPSVALPTDSLIGRYDDLQRVRRSLLDDQRRLVTLLGPGGIGKTRLALQSAADLAPHFADGVAFVPLAPVSDAADVVTAIAEAAGSPLPASQSPTDALLAFLHERSMLLVLDNLEHLLGPQHSDRISALFTHMLHHAPQVHLLVTTRERLRLREEWVIELGGLALPADERTGAIERAEAVVLFLERARQVSHDFALTPHNRAAVAQICRLLGGAPLGIELAASWVRVLSCEEIAAEIEHGTDMEMLSDRNLPARHRSLYAVMEHSWQLLSADEQYVLARMAVFRGGGTREAVAAVLAPDMPGAHPRLSKRLLLPLLAALVDKSLVRRATDTNAVTRYDLHELVRQYAAARLAEHTGEQAAVAARHATYYAEWVAHQESILKSARQKQAVQAMIAEIDNIRAAWRWGCAERNPRVLLQMFFTLDWFYEVHGWNTEAEALFAQGNAALRPVVERADASNEAQTCYWLLVGREGWHALRRDPSYAARRMHEAATTLRQINMYGGLMHVIKGLAYLQIFAGDYTSAEQLLDEALALAQAVDNAWARSVALVVRGVLETLRSDAATARQHLNRALAVARAVGDPRHVTLTLNYFGVTALNLGQLDEAERACREALTIAAEHQDRFQMSLSLQSLGRVALLRGDHAESEWLLHESLSIARDISDRWLEAQALGRLGMLASARGNRVRARQFHRAAVATAAAAPLPIALDELAALAEFELADQPGAALTALAYVQSHPLTRPAARARWHAVLSCSSAEQHADADAAAKGLTAQSPSALLALFS
jgi:predicted ATPase/DNA-binding XRE family transcriptional regulator/Tfp pilus assembly protein PilF